MMLEWRKISVSGNSAGVFNTALMPNGELQHSHQQVNTEMSGLTSSAVWTPQKFCSNCKSHEAMVCIACAASPLSSGLAGNQMLLPTAPMANATQAFAGNIAAPSTSTTPTSTTAPTPSQPVNSNIYPYSWDNRRLTYGKHKGRKYWQMTAIEETYCNELITSDPQRKPMPAYQKGFRKYLVDRGFPFEKCLSLT